MGDVLRTRKRLNKRSSNTSLYSSPPNPCFSVEGLVWDRFLVAQMEALERRFEEEEIHNAILEMMAKRPQVWTASMTFLKNC